jgi:RNA polymerase sigma-70 factor (ECF subfamily)
MCLHVARAEARLDEEGAIVLLKDQDRSLWNKELIDKGIFYLNISSSGESPGPYFIEAAIAACHVTAKNFSQTDWKTIYDLYEALSKLKAGPVVEMNRAIALGYYISAEAGLEALMKIEGLQGSYLYHAAMGDFYREVDDRENSLLAYEKAMTLTTSNAEKRLLQQKCQALL